jgi:DNA-binding IscR family transcriptional regulator
MLEHEITSERRRKKRADIVRLINRTHKSQSYGRAFSGLVKRGYLRSLEGPNGGYWLTSAGGAEAERLRSSD